MAGSGHVLRASLLVVEAALAVLLIVSAGLLVRSFIRLVNVDGGFDPSNVLVTQVYLPDANQRPARPSTFFEQLVPRLTNVPGVRAVGVGNMAPFGTEAYADRIRAPGSCSRRRAQAGDRDELGGDARVRTRPLGCASRAGGSSSRTTLTDR